MNTTSSIYDKIVLFFLDESAIKKDKNEILGVKELFFVLLLLFVLLVFYTIYFFISTPADWVKHTTNIVGTLGILISMLFLRKGADKTYASLVIIGISFSFTYISIMNSGGVYSIDIEWYLLCSVCSFLFINVKVGTIVSVLNLVLVFSLYYLEIIDFKDFKSDSIKANGLHEFFTFSFLQIIYGIVIYFFVSILKKTRESLDQANEHKMEHLNLLVEQKTIENKLLRVDIARDFHDAMGNKLASISSISQMLNINNELSPEQHKQHISKINKLSREVYDGTKDFIWALNLEQNNVLTVYIYLKDFGEQLYQSSTIDFISYPIDDSCEKFELSTYETSQLVLIVKEAMTNALVHSKAKSLVFQFEETVNEFIFTITDDGVGFDKEQLARISGIENMYVRAKKINARVDINSERSHFTKVTLSLNKQV
jgi:signal transduction histidine kinase